jgi:hypothetical protein
VLGSCRCSGYPDLACCNEAGDLVYGVGGVGAVCRRDSVDLGGDGGDALIRDAGFPCSVRCVSPVKVDRRGDALVREGMDSAPRLRR